MSVKQSENGTWYVQCWVRDLQGRQVHKVKRGFITEEDAIVWERDFREAAESTVNLSFERFLKVYEEDVRPRLREHTWINKQYVINDKILPTFGRMKLSEIKSIDIIRWQNALMQPDENGKVYSETYLRSVNNQLTAILNHAARYYGLNPNPSVKTVKMGSKETKAMQFWTKEEYIRFSDEAMSKPQSFLMFEILYWTGIREGELLALTPASFDLNPDKQTLRIDRSYQRLKGRDVITDPKTSKSVRTIKLPQFLAEEVQDYLDRNQQIGSHDRLFPTNKSYVSHEMMRICKESGVKKIRVHDIRHSHVSLLIDMGFSAVAIAERMGHESSDITFRYAHLFPNVQDNMASALNGLNERNA